jgi:hypothetical protein
MDDFIITENIRRFEQLLEISSDQRQRKVLRDLLADERRKLGRSISLDH